MITNNFKLIPLLHLISKMPKHLQISKRRERRALNHDGVLLHLLWLGMCGHSMDKNRRNQLRSQGQTAP